MWDREVAMTELAKELELLQQATHHVEAIGAIARGVETALAHAPDKAGMMVRPCATLILRLLDAQASVEALLQKLYSGEFIEARTR
jgi:hypothetical protein